MFGANLVILAQIYDESSRGQAEFPRILSQNGQNDFQGQGQWPPLSIPAESITGCMFGANLVIPAQICYELLCGQGKVYRQTDGHLYCIFDKYQVKLDAPHSAPTYLCSHILAVIFLDR